MVVLDTSILSETSRLRPNPHVHAWLDGTGNQPLGVSVAVLAEVQRGIELAREQHPQKSEDLTSWLEDLLASRVRQIDIDGPTARLWGTMVANRKLYGIWTGQASGRPRFSLDLLIAATAIVRGLPLVTMNRDDFSLIDEEYPLPGIIFPGDLSWAPRPTLLSAMAANDGGEGRSAEGCRFALDRPNAP